MIKFKKRLKEKWLQASYHPTLSPWWWHLLVPFAWIVKYIAYFRYISQYRTTLHPQIGVPVIIVGNITLGGTGKTPLVSALVTHLKQQGWFPGIISRGYGASLFKSSRQHPAAVPVSETSCPHMYGDEPVLLAQQTQVPIMIHPNRVLAGQTLVACHRCDIIISDDGLQHYSLPRQIEIAMIDGQKGFGNQQCIPAGPLRESIQRLRKVDFVICKETSSPLHIQIPCSYYSMHLTSCFIKKVSKNDALTVTQFIHQYPHMHAVAGIGHPEHFFNFLKQQGAQIIEHAFPDHYHYRQEDFLFNDDLSHCHDGKRCCKMWRIRQRSTMVFAN